MGPLKTRLDQSHFITCPKGPCGGVMDPTRQSQCGGPWTSRSQVGSLRWRTRHWQSHKNCQQRSQKSTHERGDSSKPWQAGEHKAILWKYGLRKSFLFTLLLFALHSEGRNGAPNLASESIAGRLLRRDRKESPAPPRPPAHSLWDRGRIKVHPGSTFCLSYLTLWLWLDLRLHYPRMFYYQREIRKFFK